MGNNVTANTNRQCYIESIDYGKVAVRTKNIDGKEIEWIQLHNYNHERIGSNVPAYASIRKDKAGMIFAVLLNDRLEVVA